VSQPDPDHNPELNQAFLNPPSLQSVLIPRHLLCIPAQFGQLASCPGSKRLSGCAQGFPPTLRRGNQLPSSSRPIAAKAHSSSPLAAHTYLRSLKGLSAPQPLPPYRCAVPHRKLPPKTSPISEATIERIVSE